MTNYRRTEEQLAEIEGRIEKIRKGIKQTGQTQEFIAVNAGMSIATLSRILTGRGTPDEHTLQKLEDYLDEIQ